MIKKARLIVIIEMIEKLENDDLIELKKRFDEIYFKKVT